MADNVVEKWLEVPAVKNDFHTHATSTPATPATAAPEKSPGSSSNSSSTALKTKNNQAEIAKRISSILSGLYRQLTPSEWEWLRINQPKWWTKRIELENEVDSRCLDGDPKAAQEPFFQLAEHLKAAPIDKLSSRIAQQIDEVRP